MKCFRAEILAPFAAALVIAGAEALFIGAYVTHEHALYFWDHAMYLAIARHDFQLFGLNFAAGWHWFLYSLSDNYNLVFALPSFAGFALFGPSRLVFIVTNFVVFGLAYEAGIAFILRRALGWPWRRALLFGVAAGALVPPLWFALLEGYPDIGAAAFIAFAFAFAAPAEKKRFCRGAVATGALLGAAIILRRHFAYPALALLITAGCFGIADALRAPEGKPRRDALLRAALFPALGGVTVLALLAVIEPDLLHAALTIDYTQLYASYKRPPLYFLSFVAGMFGIGLLAFAGGGLYLLGRGTGKERRLALFVSVFMLTDLVIWCHGPCEAAHHYMLHAVPLFVLVGMAGWVSFLAQKPAAKKYFIGGALLAALVFNSAAALWFSPETIWPYDDWPPGFLSAPRPPVIQTDYAEWKRLALYLEQTSTPADHILMVGSSTVFNLGLLGTVYTDVLGNPGMLARLLKDPEIDHLEGPPLDVFAASDIYVVADPAQYHLGPKGQKVVTAAFDQFPPPASRAGLFRRDDMQFHLADGVTVSVWRRSHWTPAALFAAMADIRRIAKADARFGQDWIVVDPVSRMQTIMEGGNRAAVSAVFTPTAADIGLFLDEPLGPGAYRLTFGLMANNFCPLPRYRFSVETGAGKAVTSMPFAPMETTRETSHAFSLPQGAAPYFLRFDFAPGAPAACLLIIRDLRIEAAP